MSEIIQRPLLTATAVSRALNAAIGKAELLEQNVCISICTPQGIEQGYLRMTDAPDLCANNARDKAYTAASFGVNTKQWDDILADEAPRVIAGLKQRPRFVAFGGGLPISTKDGTVVGGIGVSGASEAQDEAIALAGISILDLNIKIPEQYNGSI